MATTNKKESTNKHISVRNRIRTVIDKLRKSPMGVFSLSFSTMFLGFHGVLEVFERFKIDLLTCFQESTFIIYLFIVIILALIGIIGQMIFTNALPQQNTECTNKEQTNSDSIVEIVRHSFELGHHKDVILLGSALRQSTCLKNKNSIKIQIGHFVLEAARYCGDIETEAIALIEDIGNTHLENGEAPKAIEYISMGLEAITDKIAVLADDCITDSVYYIAIRGYRNLANCYSFNGKENEARQQLTTATTLANKINDQALKLQVMGDLEYAESKVSRITSNWKHTIKHLNKSVDFYDELCKRFPSPENERKRIESTTKNYRELGDAFFNINNYKSARKALQRGFDYATKNLDYENLVSICLLKATIANKTEPEGEGSSLAMSEAEKYIRFVDSPKILAKLEEKKKELSEKNKNT